LEERPNAISQTNAPEPVNVIKGTVEEVSPGPPSQSQSLPLPFPLFLPTALAKADKNRKTKHLLSPPPLRVRRAPGSIPLLPRTLVVLNRAERARPVLPVYHIEKTRFRRVKPRAIHDHFKAVASLGRTQCCCILVIVFVCHFPVTSFHCLKIKGERLGSVCAVEFFVFHAANPEGGDNMLLASIIRVAPRCSGATRHQSWSAATSMAGQSLCSQPSSGMRKQKIGTKPPVPNLAVQRQCRKELVDDGRRTDFFRAGANLQRQCSERHWGLRI
jgi:hypothetical protein